MRWLDTALESFGQSLGDSLFDAVWIDILRPFQNRKAVSSHRTPNLKEPLMSLDQILKPLADARRVLLNVPVQPIQGHRFQPTGFPDLGAAIYQAPIKEDESLPCLLVESAQSMANRLEATIWDTGANDLTDAAKGVSYVKVLDDKKEYLTSSIQEAHRLNSVYIEDADAGKFHKDLTAEMAYDEKKPVNRRKFVEAVFKYDANALLHGLFLESIGGRLRIARALSSFVEAEDYEVAASGGVKNDHVQPGKEEGKGAAEGHGNIPYAREEYTARSITAYFSLDLAQIRGYGLDPAAEQLLIVLGLYKIRSLLDGDLRLRTACDFEVTSDEIKAKRPANYTLPSLVELAGVLKDCIAACTSKQLFAGESGVTTVTYKPGNKPAK